MVRPRVASLIAAAALLASAGAAGAHTGALVAEISAPSTAPSRAILPVAELRAVAPVAAPLPALLAAAVVVAACASRRRLAITLVLLTAVVAVDGAVHSVHHLTDASAAAACVLASNSTHAPAVLSDGAAVVVGPARAPEPSADLAPLRTAVRSPRPDRGRAPPSSAA
jgi:hypothetical protein